MFMLPGHGTTAVNKSSMEAYGRETVSSVEAACGFTNPAEFSTATSFGAFAYYFSKADGVTHSDIRTKELDDLADAVVLDDTAEDRDSTIPPVFTYFGQFIDHDITANTDRETGISIIDSEVVKPEDRGKISKSLKNLRAGALNLDSVHGGGPIVGDFSAKLVRLMRYRHDKAKLWGGTVTPLPGNNVSTFPKSGIRDLIRLQKLIDKKMVTEAELRALPKEMRDVFINPKTDEVIKQRAIIGDMRNDENLAVAQFHMAIQRLHNAIVQRSYTHAKEHPDAPKGDTDELFEWARTRTSWIYQWLIINAYLPAICDPDTLAGIVANGPVLYREFFHANPPAQQDLLPLPLEFSVAAFRFGHTMARDVYDWNEFFDEATFGQLFQFTGNHSNAMAGLETLPSNWPIDWARFAGPFDPKKPDRATRQVDTRLAFPLGNMENEPAGDHRVLRHLARRNLRRGHRLNIPHAQAIIEELQSRHIHIQPVSADELKSGATGPAVEAGGFETQTPLWFYILKEAEVLGAGQCLGPLGTHLVADTLIGLIEKDTTSYINAAPGGAKWTPADSVKPGGFEITDMPSLMRAAGVLE